MSSELLRDIAYKEGYICGLAGQPHSNGWSKEDAIVSYNMGYDDGNGDRISRTFKVDHKLVEISTANSHYNLRKQIKIIDNELNEIRRSLRSLHIRDILS